MAFFASSDCATGPVKQLSRFVQRDPGVLRDRVRSGQGKRQLAGFRCQSSRGDNSANTLADFWSSKVLDLPQESLDYLWWQKNVLRASEHAVEDFANPVLPETWAASFLEERRDVNSRPSPRYPRQTYSTATVPQKAHQSEEVVKTVSDPSPFTALRSSFARSSYQLNPHLHYSSHLADSSWIGQEHASTKDYELKASPNTCGQSAEWDSMFTEVERQTSPHQEIDHEETIAQAPLNTLESNTGAISREEACVSGALQDLPQHYRYDFQPDNPFTGSWRAFEEGMAILEKEENLAYATLAFEAACQKDPLNVEAWKMLGSTQAENENDAAAMKAFEDALELDPTNGDALLGLAISYINGGQQQKAYTVLESWLTSKYPQVTSPSSSSSDDPHTRLISLYLSAALLHPTGPQLDPGVQVGLGMLFFSTSHYAESLDCFSTALSLTLTSPNCTVTRSQSSNAQCQPHLLYNRIGASLAKLRRYDDAVEAYEMALVARPNYVRARYNMAVVAFAKGEYEECARQAVRALGERGAGRISSGGGGREGLEDDLMSALKKALSNMGKWDLGEGVRPGIYLGDLRRALNV
ncbi:TPR-like protein [Lophium mytilinum]|uniref:TPR-like protein n=1 Tax=Lophium mytilinum TaxID=390894 RepID=A0A6A6R8X2_9PEZI|nr:TPR-like protein [Lophium mytilinum]